MEKFRAWDKAHEVMRNVLLIDFFSRSIICETDDERNIKLYDTTYELLQSTGLEDKDGVEIFEGDILKGLMDFGPAGYVESVAPVSYHKINGYQLHYFLLEHTEVIGNVYEDKNIKFGTMEE